MFPKLSRNPTPFTNAAGFLLCFKGREVDAGLKSLCYVFLPLCLSSSFPSFLFLSLQCHTFFSSLELTILLTMAS